MSKENKFKFETTIYLPPGHRLLNKDKPEEILAYHISQILAGPTGYTNSVEPMFFTQLEKVQKLVSHAKILADAVKTFVKDKPKDSVGIVSKHLLDLATTVQNTIDWMEK